MQSVDYFVSQLEAEQESSLQMAIFIGITKGTVNASNIDDSEKMDTLGNLIEAWDMVQLRRR